MTSRDWPWSTRSRASRSERATSVSRTSSVEDCEEAGAIAASFAAEFLE
jgi:hypothetical protein